MNHPRPCHPFHMSSFNPTFIFKDFLSYVVSMKVMKDRIPLSDVFVHKIYVF